VKPVVDRYDEIFDEGLGIVMRVRYARTGRTIDGYAITLVAKVEGAVETIRLFDTAHGFNEMHRYTRSGGKQTGKPFHSGTFGEGMRAAISQVKSGRDQMIEGWER
jgi:hypothetical protein